VEAAVQSDAEVQKRADFRADNADAVTALEGDVAAFGLALLLGYWARRAGSGHVVGLVRQRL